MPIRGPNRTPFDMPRPPRTFCGLLFLFSAQDATPVAMINDGILQHIRVGGGAGLGVKYLARQNSEIVGMIGSGGWPALFVVRAFETGGGLI
jgi:alanine dehydrogenase